VSDWKKLIFLNLDPALTEPDPYKGEGPGQVREKHDKDQFSWRVSRTRFKDSVLIGWLVEMDRKIVNIKFISGKKIVFIENMCLVASYFLFFYENTSMPIFDFFFVNIKEKIVHIIITKEKDCTWYGNGLVYITICFSVENPERCADYWGENNKSSTANKHVKGQ
jgi:hypothetical protein